MRKRKGGGIFLVIVLLLLGGSVAGTAYLVFGTSDGDEVQVRTETAETRELVQKTVATGKIIPRREVLIKPRVSGIIRAIEVQPGDVVAAEELIAEIQIVPNVAQLNEAESQVTSAQIALKHAETELLRAERLSEEGLVSKRELAERNLTKELRQAELTAAINALSVVREGAISTSDESSNTRVRSTVAGTVLDVPIEQGVSVIETNTFNEGTTIAVVADMNDMIFEGFVDEADVGRIEPGMDVTIKVGAIEDATFPAKLEYIAPKGQELEGAIQFEIRAAVQPAGDITIRAGYSANAEIVLSRREKALSIKEALLKFEDDSPYVEVQIGAGQFERRDLEVGVSDGIYIEVLSGLEEGDEVKVPEPEIKPE